MLILRKKQDREDALEQGGWGNWEEVELKNVSTETIWKCWDLWDGAVVGGVKDEDAEFYY